MSKRQPKVSSWQDAPMPREQVVLFAETLEDGESADRLPGPLQDLKDRRQKLGEHFKLLEQTDPDARILPNKEGGYAPNYTPLAEPKCKDNPAIRDDPTQPVAEEDLDRLPTKPVNTLGRRLSPY